MRSSPPTRYKGLFKKAIKGSRKSAIRFFCLECMGWSPAEVKRCTAPDCALYRYRISG